MDNQELTIPTDLYAVGIDFGTTKSGLSYCPITSQFTYQSEMVNLQPDNYFIPSCVYVDVDSNSGNQIFLVGEEAVARFLETEDESCFFAQFKLDLHNNTRTEQYARLGVTPSMIVAALLNYIVRYAENGQLEAGKPITQVTLTIPAKWGQSARKQMEEAAQAIGLRSVTFIKEPSAALIHLDSKNLLRPLAGKNVMVIDYGGGTCDVAICKVPEGDPGENEAEIISEKMEVDRVGGYEMDRSLADLFIERAKEFWNISQDDHRLERVRLDYVWKAEDSKIRFTSWYNNGRKSNHPLREAHLTFPDEIGILSIPLTEELLDSVYHPIYSSIKKPIQEALTEANLELSDLSKIFLVGGANMLPMIRKWLKEEYPEASSSFEMVPETRQAICLGAARWQYYQMRKDENFPISPIYNRSLYIEHEKSKGIVGQINRLFVRKPEGLKHNTELTKLISQGTPLSKAREPKSLRFKTICKETTELTIVIVEGDSEQELANPKMYYSTILRFSKPVPNGTRIKVDYSVDLSGRLILTAKAFTLEGGKEVIVAKAEVFGDIELDQENINDIRKALGIIVEEGENGIG